MRRERMMRPALALGAAASALLFAACDPNTLPPGPIPANPAGCYDAPGTFRDIGNVPWCHAQNQSTASVLWDRRSPVEYAWPDEWADRFMPGSPDGTRPNRGVSTTDTSTGALRLTRGGNGGVVATTASTVVGTADMGSILSIAAHGGSTVRAVVAGGSTLVAGARDGAAITARLEDASRGWFDAYGGSVDALLLGGSTAEVTTGWGSADVEARGASDVTVFSTQGADTTVYADGGSTVYASGDQTAVTDVRATGGSNVDVTASYPGLGTGPVTARIDASGASNVVANLFKSSADITASGGASVTANGDFYGTVYASVDAAIANIAASGENSTADVRVAGSGSTATVIPVVVAVANNGGTVTQDFAAGDGARVSTTAEGEGSLAEVTGYRVVGVVTVYASEGGHAFVYTREDDSVEFGCVGGVTSVTTDAGSCSSDGDTARYVYPDGREVLVGKASDGSETRTTKTVSATTSSVADSSTAEPTASADSASSTTVSDATRSDATRSDSTPSTTTADRAAGATSSAPGSASGTSATVTPSDSTPAPATTTPAPSTAEQSVTSTTAVTPTTVESAETGSSATQSAQTSTTGVEAESDTTAETGVAEAGSFAG